MSDTAVLINTAVAVVAIVRFWLLQSLMGQTTRGTLKTCSAGVSIASVVALGPILALSLVL